MTRICYSFGCPRPMFTKMVDKARLNINKKTSPSSLPIILGWQVDAHTSYTSAKSELSTHQLAVGNTRESLQAPRRRFSNLSRSDLQGYSWIWPYCQPPIIFSVDGAASEPYLVVVHATAQDVDASQLAILRLVSLLYFTRTESLAGGGGNYQQYPA
jgi:hypothetical protein